MLIVFFFGQMLLIYFVASLVCVRYLELLSLSVYRIYFPMLVRDCVDFVVEQTHQIDPSNRVKTNVSCWQIFVSRFVKPFHYTREGE